jgi:3-hydroxyacyl-CoA dehydrogenase
MIVTIIGAGMMGRGIGTRLLAGGTDVELIDKDPASAGRLAQELTGQGKASATIGRPAVSAERSSCSRFPTAR